MLWFLVAQVELHRPLPLLTENPPWPQSPEPVLALVVSGGGVQSGMTWTNIRGEALCVHISEVLTNLQPVALP